MRSHGSRGVSRQTNIHAEKDPHPPYLELAQALGCVSNELKALFRARVLMIRRRHKLHSIKKVVEAKNLTNMRKRKQGKKVRAVYDVDEFIPQVSEIELLLLTRQLSHNWVRRRLEAKNLSFVLRFTLIVLPLTERL